MKKKCAKLVKISVSLLLISFCMLEMTACFSQKGNVLNSRNVNDVLSSILSGEDKYRDSNVVSSGISLDEVQNMLNTDESVQEKTGNTHSYIFDDEIEMVNIPDDFGSFFGLIATINGERMRFSLFNTFLDSSLKDDYGVHYTWILVNEDNTKEPNMMMFKVSPTLCQGNEYFFYDSTVEIGEDSLDAFIMTLVHKDETTLKYDSIYIPAGLGIELADDDSDEMKLYAGFRSIFSSPLPLRSVDASYAEGSEFFMGTYEDEFYSDMDDLFFILPIPDKNGVLHIYD